MIHRWPHYAVIGGALAACLGACGGESDGGAGGASGSTITISGTVSAGALPAGAKAILIWGGEPRAKFGEAPITGDSFTMNIPSPPPAYATVAVGDGQVAIATIFVVPGDFEIGDGPLTIPTSQLDTAILASDVERSVIWRSGSTEDVEWTSAFPDGQYACGRCVDVASGFESYAATLCGMFLLSPGGALGDTCNCG